ncbi:hypothetical protein HD806DRAFT_533894 [Xylariaceae sp. AK1471]|nr:hypothetical protein HD806DRAFT_533894 [Xylariaceae sp. AK1471]
MSAPAPTTASRGGRGGRGEGQGGTSRGGAAGLRRQRVQAFLFPGSNASSLNYIPLPETSSGFCRRCGQLASGTSCHFCYSDFSEAFDKIANAGKSKKPTTGATTTEPDPTIKEKAAMKPDSTKSGSLPFRGSSGHHADGSFRWGPKRELAEEEDPGEIISPAKRRRKIKQAEAAIRLQLGLLREERRRLNEGRGMVDEVAYFAHRDIDDPACKAPEFEAPFIRRFVTLPDPHDPVRKIDRVLRDLDPEDPPRFGYSFVKQ